MKSLFEIINNAKSGDMPSHEECYWAMLAFNALNALDAMGLRSLVEKKAKFITPDYILNESFTRTKRALESDPKIFVGPEHDPSSEDYQYMRRIGLKIFDNIMSKKS